MKKAFFFILLGFISYRASAAPLADRPWPSQSSPHIMSRKFEKKFSKLPRAGIVTESKKYWSNDYWPLFKGSINFRWYSRAPVGFNLISPNKEEVLRMSLEELKELAPSEKFDLLVGRYNYSLKKEVSKRSSPRRKEWEGICNGWAGAALNHIEPRPRLLKNKDGVTIPFGSSDIKALLSYYYSFHYGPVRTYQMGRRCRGEGSFCNDDLNAGAFHIVLTNKVGMEGKGFIADIDRGVEVWNHVVHSFYTKIINDNLPPSRESARETAKVIKVSTTIKVVFNIESNSWEEALGTPLQRYQEEHYEYELDIDSNGRIIGGDWISKKRPDFLWTIAPVKKFTGILAGLEKLLD